ncbi:MAG: CTP-dependent riboflavin kinase [Nitrososphaerota archaeon]|nr:CTP-dependent riboflavin kinase [Nitrososphaerota archaeon]
MPRQNAGVSSEQLTALLHLVKLGAVRSFSNVTTRMLGESMGLSQQAASLRLAALQRAGLAERAHSGRGLAVRLTESGLDAVETFLAEVGSNLERGKDTMQFRGTVFTGLNEGAYYVSTKGYAEGFAGALGFEPFPGTLNLRLTSEAMIGQRRRLDLLKGIEIPGFSDGKRSYGGVKCFRAKVAGRHPGAVLAIERTHHDSSVLEVISPVNLRRSLGLKDGDECAVMAYLGEGWARRR